MIGERLRRSRINLGLSQKDLAEKLKITSSAISMYESGRRLPSLEMFIKLIEVLNVSADEILGYSAYVTTHNTNYSVLLAKEDLKIIREIKKHKKLYKRLCMRTEDIITMLNKKIG